MPEPKTPLQGATMLCSGTLQLKFSVRETWAASMRNYSALWPLATPFERLKLACYFPINLILLLGYSLNGLFWFVLGTMWLRVEVALIKTSPDGASYGEDLATIVADKLEDALPSGTSSYGSGICFHHRDYCGQGLFYGWEPKAGFMLAHCNDGFPGDEVLHFSSRAEFVAWLALQSDLSLSGVHGPLKDWRNAGNQRVTKARLLDYIGQAT